MCQSRAEGGRRCAANTRFAYRKALDEVLSACSLAEARRARDEGRAAMVAHAMTPTGRAEVEAEAEKVYRSRRKYVDGGRTASWLAQCVYEADEEKSPPSKATSNRGDMSLAVDKVRVMDVVVRGISGEDWADFRDVRLRALADSPDAFGATLTEAEAKPEAAWRDLVDGPGPRVLALSAEGPVAMGGLYMPEGVPDAFVWGMWVDPNWRGQRLGSRILVGLLNHARQESRAVLLHVTEGNEQARRFYEEHGFVSTGEWQPLRDGSEKRVETMRWQQA